MDDTSPALSERERRREFCKRFYGNELARAVFPEPLA